ncbi:hypothetical protein Tco_1040754, partial [Tanacetum coccineum]
DTHKGTGLKPGVLDVSKADSSDNEYESWGVSDDDDDQQGDDERTKSDDDDSVDLNKTDDEEKTQEDEFVHTPDDYVPTDDETDDVDDEEYDRINKEMYDDVNVELKDAEFADAGKGDEEITDAEKVNVELEEVNQEVASAQVQDEALATTTAAHARVTSSNRSVSSNYGSIYLNLDNISSVETKIISMLDVQVQHEFPCIQTSPLLVVPMTVISKPSVIIVTVAPATNIPPPIPPFISHSQQSKPMPTPTTVEATTLTTTILESATLSTIHQRVFDLEKEVKILRNIDHNLAIRATIKSEVTIVVKEYLGTNLEDSLHKVIQKQTAECIREHTVPAAVLKKRKPDDVDRDEDPPTGPDQGLKRRKTSKDAEPSKKNLGEDMGKIDEPPIVKADPKDWFKKPKRPPTPDPEWNTCKTVDDGPTQNRLSDLAKAEKPSKMFNELMSTPIDFTAFAMNRFYVELEYNMEECYKALNDQLDWNNPEGDKYPFDLSKPLPLVESRNRMIVPADYFFNNDLAYLQGGSIDRKYMTSLNKTKAAKYDLQGIEDMVPMLWSPIKVAYDTHALLGTLHWGPKRQRFYGYASNRVSKHDVYSTKRILIVTNVKVNKWRGHCALGRSITYVYKTYCNPEESGRSLTWSRKLPEEAQHLKATDIQGWHL